MEETKVCSKCGETKSIDEFNKDKSKSDGHRPDCKVCTKIASDKWYENNKEDILQKQRDKYKNDPDEKLKCNNKWQAEHPEKAKEYRQINKNKENERDKQRKKTDLLYKTKKNIRTLLWCSFSRCGFTKSSHTFEILTESFEICTDYLLNTGFGRYDDFSVEKYLNGEYEIDHITPLSTAKTIEDVIRLNHISNLQLLTVKDNRDKSDKLDWEKL